MLPYALAPRETGRQTWSAALRAEDASMERSLEQIGLLSVAMLCVEKATTFSRSLL